MNKTDIQQKHYVVYRTTNNINGKIYIGKHITNNLNDNYLGSGKLLKRAINKYGVENFTKEILHIFDNETDMNEKEKELVTEEFVLQETNYNLCVGGQGGFSYINANGLGVSDKQKEAAKNTMGTIWNNRKSQLLEDPEWRKQYVAKLSAASARKGKPGTRLGIKHSEETKAKMSARSKGKGTGKQNSQFGSRWITNGQTAKKIKKTDRIPDGWRAGRK